MSKENEGTAIKLGVRNSAEENRQIMREALLNNEEIKDYAHGVQRRWGFDVLDPKCKLLERNFSWKKLRSKTLREADGATLFPQLLRAGVQTMVNSMYQTVPTTFEEWAHVIQSTKDTELYAPLHGITFPREVGRQEKYSESRAAGLDIKLRNKKYGTLYPIEKELVNDDQTGQITKQAGLLGQYLKQVLEVLAYAKLASASAGSSYADMFVPSSETQPSDEATYPYVPASAPFVGGGYNRPASYALLTQASLQAGFQALVVQKNLLGLRQVVQPDRVIVGPRYQFDLAVLLNSGYYPTGATAGATGGAFSINPLKGIADATVSRFIFRHDTGALDDGTSAAWWLVDSKVPWFIVQIREGAIVEQEAPNSGEDFERDIYRFKGRTRANADFIDPRFVWLGNDGSVTS